jgi:hypothetical protein
MAATGLAALTACGPAAAAHWREPLDITPHDGFTIYLSDLAVDRHGDVAALGETYSKPDGLVAYTSIDRDPFTGEEINDSGGEDAFLCFDRNGALVVLSHRVDVGNLIRVYTRPSRRRFGPERLLDTRPGEPWGIATSPKGEVFAYWTGTNPEGTVDGPARIAVRPARGGGFGPVQDLSASEAGGLRLLFDRHGNALMLWQVDGRVEYAIRHPGGSFGPARVLASSADAFADYLDVAANRDGRAVAVWRAHPGKHNTMRAAFGSVAGGFGESRRFAGRANRGPYAALDAGGEAVVAWRAAAKDTYALRAALATAGSTRFGRARELARGYVAPIRPVADDRGTATVAWIDADGLRAARHRPGRGFTSELVAEGPLRGAGIGATANGRTVIASSTYKKHVEAAVARPGHSFGRSQDIGGVKRGESLYGPVISTGGDGGAFVWWGGARSSARETRWFAGSYLDP